jgi:nucleotide-binding universal stress UspA family protein
MSSLPYQSILCPVDFSSGAGDALRIGSQLAKSSGVPLKVIYATHFEAPPFINESAQMELAKGLVNAKLAAQDALASWCEPFLAPGAEVTYEILERPPVDAIHAVAETMPGCWIVMGTHGRTGLKRLLLGSVTERTLREVGVPVVTIPPRHTD